MYYFRSLTQKYESVNKEKLPIHIMQIKSTTPLFQIVLVSSSLESSYKKCYITFSIFRITHQALLTLLKYLQFCSWYCIVYYYYKSRQANLIVIICCCLVTQSCLTICDSMDCSSPGSSIHGILQARILDWVAICSSRESS